MARSCGLMGDASGALQGSSEDVGRPQGGESFLNPVTHQERVIAAYSLVARPILLTCMPRRSCIASARVAVECLKGFGVASVPVPVRFVLQAPALNAVYISGVGLEEQSHLREISSEWVALPPQDALPPWNGHLVLSVGRKFLIDPSFDQAMAGLVESGHVVDDRPRTLVLPLTRRFRTGVQALYDLRMDDGLQIQVDYLAGNDMSFLTTPAWELDHMLPLIHTIKRQMRHQLQRG